MRTGALAETWDRIVGSDPGLTQLRQAGSAVIAMASAIGVEYAFALVTHADGQTALIAMLLGAIVAMMGSMALTGTGVWRKVGIAVFFPVALGIGMVIGVAVGDRTDLMLGIFVVVMFAAVFVRRFGGAFFFYGFMLWMGYFFAAFLHATAPMLPGLLIYIVIASVWVLLLSVTVLRTNPSRTLRRVVRAFDARARSVARACADLLNAFGTDERHRARLRRRLGARTAGLVEAALMVEGWSAEPGALPPGWHASGLRRRLLDAQHLIEQLVHAATSFTARDGEFALAAAKVADRLARRDDRGANLAAYELAEAAEAAGTEAAGWWPARHFAAAALEFIALVKQAGKPAPASEGFQPAVDLALGLLPGSPAVAKDVPARGVRWNPLARLDMVSRQAIQVAVAGGIAILLGREISETRYYWAVLAAFIMFAGTATRTEAFLKGFNRVLGTLIGLVAAIGFAELTAGSTVGVLLVVNLSMFFGFYLINRSYAYMIFFVTIMVGQLYSVFHEFSPGFMVLRLEETALGAAIGFAVALLVTPLSTRDTVRSARDGLLSTLADLLRAAADRLDGAGNSAVLDALSRALDDRMRRLALVARPLTRPVLSSALSPRLRHRLVLYAALTTHARALVVATRAEPAEPSPGPAQACRALADAAVQVEAVPVGKTQPKAAAPLALADTALFALTPAAPGIRATDPVLRTLAHLHHLIRDVTAPGRTPDPADAPVPGELPARTLL